MAAAEVGREEKLWGQLWNSEDNLPVKDIVSYNMPASKEGIYLFYNPPLESAKNETCTNSAKPSDIDCIFCNFFFFFFLFNSTEMEKRIFID